MAAGRAPQNLELPELDKKEKLRINRAIDKLNREVEKHAKQAEEFLDMISTSGPRVTMKPGEISRKIYQSGVINPQPNAFIRRLPSELTCKLLERLPTRADQVCLALTCKWFAAIDDAHRGQLREKTRHGTPRPYSKTQKQEVMVRLQGWVPEQYALCYTCLKFKPRNKAGWQTKMEVPAGGTVPQRAIALAPRCPRCCEWHTIQQGKETARFKRALERIKAVVKKI